jgi:hypothetical protein
VAYKRTSSETFFRKETEKPKTVRKHRNAGLGDALPIPAAPRPDEGISFRYAPKRDALRAPLGLPLQLTPSSGREEESSRQKQLFGNSIAELDVHNFEFFCLTLLGMSF